MNVTIQNAIQRVCSRLGRGTPSDDKTDSVSHSIGSSDCPHDASVLSTNEHDVWENWTLRDSYTRGETYWTENDAAFVETREAVYEFQCDMCGEEHTILTGDGTGTIIWKDELTTEELAQRREDAQTSAFYNGRLWWETTQWDGTPEDVATSYDWVIDIGYQRWKEGVDEEDIPEDVRSIVTE